MYLKEDNLSIISFSGYQHIYGADTNITFIYKYHTNCPIPLVPKGRSYSNLEFDREIGKIWSIIVSIEN
jgi:hypothetical protein